MPSFHGRPHSSLAVQKPWGAAQTCDITEPVCRNGRALVSGPRVPGFKPRLRRNVLSSGKEIKRHCQVTPFAKNAQWAETSLLFAAQGWSGRPIPLNFENEYFIFALGKEITVQAAVGSVFSWGRLRLSWFQGYLRHNFRLRTPAISALGGKAVGSHKYAVCSRLGRLHKIRQWLL